MLADFVHMKNKKQIKFYLENLFGTDRCKCTLKKMANKNLIIKIENSRNVKFRLKL